MWWWENRILAAFLVGTHHADEWLFDTVSIRHRRGDTTNFLRTYTVRYFYRDFNQLSQVPNACQLYSAVETLLLLPEVYKVPFK